MILTSHMLLKEAYCWDWNPKSLTAKLPLCVSSDMPSEVLWLAQVPAGWPRTAGWAFCRQGPEVTLRELDWNCRHTSWGTYEVPTGSRSLTVTCPILSWLKEGFSLLKLQHGPQSVREFHMYVYISHVEVNLHTIRCIDFKYDWMSFDEDIHL